MIYLRSNPVDVYLIVIPPGQMEDSQSQHDSEVYVSVYTNMNEKQMCKSI